MSNEVTKEVTKEAKTPMTAEEKAAAQVALTEALKPFMSEAHRLVAIELGFEDGVMPDKLLQVTRISQMIVVKAKGLLKGKDKPVRTGKNNKVSKFREALCRLFAGARAKKISEEVMQQNVNDAFAAPEAQADHAPTRTKKAKPEVAA